MELDQIYLVSPKKEIVDLAGLKDLEDRLKVNLPNDYCEFLIRFGGGDFCGCLSHFNCRDLLEGQQRYQSIFREFYLWDTKTSALSKQEVIEAIWLARSIDGDEIVFHPSKSPGLFLLPRNSETILPIGSRWEQVLDFFAYSGVVFKTSQFPWFCTFKDRCRLHLVKDEEIDHDEAEQLAVNAFGLDRKVQDETREFTSFFCPNISGYVHVYSDSFDIHHDLNSDQFVSLAAERTLKPKGFRVVEHFRPTILPT